MTKYQEVETVLKLQVASCKPDLRAIHKIVTIHFLALLTSTQRIHTIQKKVKINLRLICHCATRKLKTTYVMPTTTTKAALQIPKMHHFDSPPLQLSPPHYHTPSSQLSVHVKVVKQYKIKLRYVSNTFPMR